ncbi:GntR family transcriptional regulator [Acinetobacter venetianus]|uniref:GntR family transcriptional regulator n=1 Tax=Acinetobacter venetianus TaxID=52133 RepID=UPI003A927C15
MSEHKIENESRSEVVYKKLLTAIQNGTFEPGTRIREVEMAELFGISRTPVRDAIRRLESDGLLIHVPRQGAVIKKLERREIIELYEIRQVLEGTAARYAANHASTIEIDELEMLNDIMLNSIKEPIKVADSNRLFHKSLYQAANNRYLISTLESLSHSMTLLGGTTLDTPERIKEAYEEHLEIINAIKNKDEDKAEKSAQRHIRNAQNLRMKMLLSKEME